MNVDLFKRVLEERLTTRDLVAAAAQAVDVSIATMYRYKSDPAVIPFGKIVTLGKYLAFPIEGTVAWSRADVLQGEHRRLELEQRVSQAGGRRFTVTPSYTVAAELPEMTRGLWQFDYPSREGGEFEQYLELRAQRRKLYLDGKYNSLEIITAGGYRDFFFGEGRFTGIPKALRDKQVAELLKSLKLPHVQRRVYTQNTPEVPVITCYSTAIAVIRVDDITIEFNDSPKVSELIEVFDYYFKEASIAAKDEIADFLRNPGNEA